MSNCIHCGNELGTSDTEPFVCWRCIQKQNNNQSIKTPFEIWFERNYRQSFEDCDDEFYSSDWQFTKESIKIAFEAGYEKANENRADIKSILESIE